jgi:replicative DNA helicase
MIEEFSIQELPHANGPEKGVLSALMNNSDLRAETSLDPEIFYLPAHRTLYREMIAAGESFELVTFYESLNKRGHLDDVGGPVAIGDIYTHSPSGNQFKAHLASLRDCHARRMAIAAARKASEAAFDQSGADGPQNYLDALGGPISAVFDYVAGITPERDTKELAREFIEEFEKRLAGHSTPMGLLTGIHEIDGTLPGLHPGHMGIISGPPGGGKSTLATQIAGNLADNGTPVLYLPYERGPASVYSRAIIQRAGVSHQVVKDPKTNPPNTYDLRKIRDAVQSSVGTLHFPQPQSRKAAACIAMIRRYHRKHGVKVVMIDQIGLLSGERRKGATAEEELRLISNSIQELAQELQITIIVLCQVTAEGDTKNARAIEEDADWWLSIILERNKAKANFGEHQHILVAKDSHNGKSGTKLELILNRDTLRFITGKPERPEPEKRNRFQP